MPRMSTRRNGVLWTWRIQWCRLRGFWRGQSLKNVTRPRRSLWRCCSTRYPSIFGVLIFPGTIETCISPNVVYIGYLFQMPLLQVSGTSCVFEYSAPASLSVEVWGDFYRRKAMRGTEATWSRFGLLATDKANPLFPFTCMPANSILTSIHSCLLLPCLFPPSFSNLITRCNYPLSLYRFGTPSLIFGFLF